MSGRKRTPTIDRNHAKRPRVDGNHSEKENSTHNGYFAGHGLMFAPTETSKRTKPKTLKDLKESLPHDSKVHTQLQLIGKNKATRDGLEEAISSVKDKPAFSEHEDRLKWWLKYIIERENTQNECVDHIAMHFLSKRPRLKQRHQSKRYRGCKLLGFEEKAKENILKLLEQMVNTDSKLK